MQVEGTASAKTYCIRGRGRSPVKGGEAREVKGVDVEGRSRRASEKPFVLTLNEIADRPLGVSISRAT